MRHVAVAQAMQIQLHDPLPPPGRRRLLLPGAVPGRRRNPAGLADQMRHHGLPVRAARNTALMEAITASSSVPGR
jgi:hypothetical protein